jgi:hypothetical protein
MMGGVEIRTPLVDTSEERVGKISMVIVSVSITDESPIGIDKAPELRVMTQSLKFITNSKISDYSIPGF